MALSAPTRTSASSASTSAPAPPGPPANPVRRSSTPIDGSTTTKWCVADERRHRLVAGRAAAADGRVVLCADECERRARARPARLDALRLERRLELDRLAHRVAERAVRAARDDEELLLQQQRAPGATTASTSGTTPRSGISRSPRCAWTAWISARAPRRASARRAATAARTTIRPTKRSRPRSTATRTPSGASPPPMRKSLWQYDNRSEVVINAYSLTSANDVPQRDPEGLDAAGLVGRRELDQSRRAPARPDLQRPQAEARLQLLELDRLPLLPFQVPARHGRVALPDRRRDAARAQRLHDRRQAGDRELRAPARHPSRPAHGGLPPGHGALHPRGLRLASGRRDGLPLHGGRQRTPEGPHHAEQRPGRDDRGARGGPCSSSTGRSGTAWPTARRCACWPTAR